MANSAVALFCEDVRPELTGQHTLVGILPDNIEVPALPISMPKLGVYVRATIESTQRLNDIAISFRNTDGSAIELAQWKPATIQKGWLESNANGLPIYGLISTAVFSPFQIHQAGHLTVTVTIDGVNYVAGVLNISAASIASVPPGAQSQPASPQT
jgi:hypothetical protein